MNKFDWLMAAGMTATSALAFMYQYAYHKMVDDLIVALESLPKSKSDA